MSPWTVRRVVNFPPTKTRDFREEKLPRDRTMDPAMWWDRVVLLREKPVRASRSTLRQPRFPSDIRVSRGERGEHAFFAFSRPNGTATKQHRLPFQPSSPSTTVQRIIMFSSREAIHPLSASQISLR